MRLALLTLFLAGTLPASASDWPQILGPNRDGVSTESEALEPWGAAGPSQIWRRQVGQGFAGPAVVGERLLLFHRVGNEERVVALDARSGEESWSYGYPTRYRDDFGFDEGPRAVPTVAGDTVFTFGAEGVLSALALESGELRWQIRTHERFGVRKGFFGAAGSPLVDSGRVLLNLGGGDGAGIVAFDATSGERLWQATDHGASYSSGTVATLGKGRRALFLTREGLVVLDPATGGIDFEFRWRARIQSSVNAAIPLAIGERIFLSASYRTGAVLLEVDEGGPERIWSSDDVLSNHYASSVHHDGYLYGLHGRQEYGPALRAVELASGRVAWSSDRFGAGTLLRVAGRLLILKEDGELMLAEASPAALEVLARAQILDGTVRAYPAYAGGRLFARSGRELVAVRLRTR